MSKLYATLLLCCLAVFSACNFKPKPEELFEKQKSGVVLICNQYYYELTLPDGTALYFKGLDDEGDITGLATDLLEIKADPGVLTGTGFFIDEHGKILTNRHVVAPEVDKDMVRRSMNTILAYLALRIEKTQEEMEEKHQALREYAVESLVQDEYGNVQTTLSTSELYEIKQELARLESEYKEAESTKQNIRNNISAKHFEVKLHSKYGVVYDGETIDGWDDFMAKPCVLVRAAKDEGTDLALLRLKSNETPTGKYVFDMKAAEDNAPLTISQTLYMIGYNAGVTLAQTSKGISAQFTSGTVTQTPDAERVMYSIPTIQGSSGAPVVDEYGHVVAVNFAKFKLGDNFNFGMPMSRIKAFLRGE